MKMHILKTDVIGEWCYHFSCLTIPPPSGFNPWNMLPYMETESLQM